MASPLRFPLRSLMPALLIAAFLLPCGCGGSGKRLDLSDDSAVTDSADYADLTGEAWLWADSVASSLSVEERVGQCFMPALFARMDAVSLASLRSYVADFHVGGILLLSGTIADAAAIADTLAAMRGAVPPLLAIDAEWGLGMRLTDAPVFPVNSDISDEAAESDLYDYGRELARECREVGIGMVLGPVADVAKPRSVMGRRSFGPDARRVANLTVAYARGVEDGGVLSVVKHFPGHGSPDGDSHLRLQVVTRSPGALDSIDLVPFEHYVRQGLSGVMVGHLAVPALDSVMRPAAVSPMVIQDLLRGKMGFDGLVLTDALNMKGADGYDSADALAAGADIVVAPADTRREMNAVMRALRERRLSVADVTDRCRRVLFYKYLASLDRSLPRPDSVASRVWQGYPAELSRRLHRR